MAAIRLFMLLTVVGIAIAMATDTEDNFLDQHHRPCEVCYKVRTRFCTGRHVRNKSPFQQANGDKCRCHRYLIGICRRSYVPTTIAPTDPTVVTDLPTTQLPSDVVTEGLATESASEISATSE